MRISDWSSDVCSSDLGKRGAGKCGNASDFRSEQALHMTREDDLGQSNENAVDSHRISDCRSIPAQIIDRIKCPYDRQRLERSEEHTSELKSLMRISYAVFCLKKKKKKT